MLGLLAKMAALSQKVELDLSALHRSLDVLAPRSRLVIVLRYGFDDEETHTLSEIAERLSLTRERVRQIERHAIQTLLKGRSYRVTLQ